MKKTIVRKISFCLCPLFILISSYHLYGDGWWHVYFTSPGKNQSVKTKNPETALIEIIKTAKESFYGAFYDITSKQVIEEIINAKSRGINVMLVIEKDNLNKKETKELVKADINIITDDRKALMHNKFAVIDGTILWTGSYNLTYNDAHKNNNNAIEIHSEDIAKIYLDEFREMHDYKIFGNKKEYMVFPGFRKTYYVKVDDTDINVYFSPEDNIERIILERLKKAKQSVYFLAYSFTSGRLGEEMITLSKKGITVHGLIEKVGSNTKDSQYVKLKLDGVGARLDKNRNKMHHKVIVIDGSIVITGSYNFSKAANEKNDENIIIFNNKDIAKVYIEEFNALNN